MSVKVEMTAADQQEAFDLLASLIELQAQNGNPDTHAVWDHAREFVDAFRANGQITRRRHLSDFS